MLGGGIGVEAPHKPAHACGCGECAPAMSRAKFLNQQVPKSAKISPEPPADPREVAQVGVTTTGELVTRAVTSETTDFACSKDVTTLVLGCLALAAARAAV